MKGIREALSGADVEVLIAHVERLERFVACMHQEVQVGGSLQRCGTCGAQRASSGAWHLPIDPPAPNIDPPAPKKEPIRIVKRFGSVDASVERLDNVWWLWRVGMRTGLALTEALAWECAEAWASIEQCSNKY